MRAWRSLDGDVSIEAFASHRARALIARARTPTGARATSPRMTVMRRTTTKLMTMMTMTTTVMTTRTSDCGRMRGIFRGITKTKASSETSTGSMASSMASTTTSTESNANDVVVARLRKGLEYERALGWANAKGKAFDDFQSFLTASLRELERACESEALARMARESTSYGALDREKRKALLETVAAALPGLESGMRSKKVGEATREMRRGISEPRAWSAPPVKKERTSAASSVLATKTSRATAASASATTREAPVKPSKVVITRASSEFPTVIIFDLETTGLSKEKARIVEIAAQTFGSSPSSFTTLVNPGRFNIPAAVTELTGITNSMVSAADIPSFAMAAEQLEAFVDRAREARPGAPVLLVAHNARQFDAAFLQHEYRRLGRELPTNWRFCDTLPLARAMLRPTGITKFNLDFLRQYYAIAVPDGDGGMHRALTDARVLAEILNRLLEHPSAKADELGSLEKYSFSMGDPGAGSLKRAMAESKSDSDKSSHSYAGGAPGWGGGGTISLSDGEEAEYGGGWAAVDGFEEEENLENFRDGGESSSSSSSVPLRGMQKPFWAAEDPINGIIPETIDFQKLVEAAPATPNPELRLDIARWKETPIDVLTDKVPKATMKALQAEGIPTIEAILRNCPRKYQEYSVWNKQHAPGTAVTITGIVRSMQLRDSSRGKITPNTILVEVEVDPSTRETSATPGQPWGGDAPRCKVKVWDYITKEARLDVAIGSRVNVRGTLANGDRYCEFIIDTGRIVSIAPDAPIMPSNGSEIVPTYGKRGAMTNIDWYGAVNASLDVFEKKLPADPMEVAMGQDNPLLTELGLLSHIEAVRSIHRPRSVESVAQARERLAFEELVLLQVALLQERSRLQSLPSNGSEEGICIVGTALTDELRSELPFALTRSQESSLEEILSDMAGPAPMLRLLQGDVGCGKTVVAALALLAACGAGHQGAFMAPTEVLATQHHRVLTELLAVMRNPPKVALLTGSAKPAERAQILEDLKDGKIGVLVGTQTLIQDKVVFHSLGIAVVDEQHRFGVEQRAALLAKGRLPPHMLTMSATPIPRTLAMTKFGEMALSVIDEKPSGRLPIVTTVCGVDEHEKAYSAMCAEVAQGGQAFIILRLVNESGSSRMAEVKGAEEEYTRLVNAYPNVRFGLLHGQLGAEEKAAALENFANGKTQALVATSVVEVGVDVPNASMIIIEDADGFGLAALHQLRGRVGRGARQSRCFLLHSPGAGENKDLKEDRARDRLRVLEQSNNGFRIAESDLQLRGAGELFGTKQSGQQVNLFHASMSTDLYLLEAARKSAAEMISRSYIKREALPAPILVALETRPALILDNVTVAAGAAATSAAIT